jgi:response regulator RpfG family c-di-GMP phosphodiesterase
MQAVAAVIRAHHERFDGEGFPDKRVGHDIPLGARILAIVDTFDDLQNGHLVETHQHPIGTQRA